MTTLFAFLHHLLAFVLVVLLAVELVLVRPPLMLENARKLIVIDGLYGASAGLLLFVGFARVFFFEKGAYYYFTSHAFLTKLGLFLLVGIASVVPTMEFLRWRKVLARGELPAVGTDKLVKMRRIIHLELAGVLLILFFAAMAARGG